MINSLSLSKLISIKPLSERALDEYWNSQIKKSRELEESNISIESKLKQLSWYSWISFAKSTLIYLGDLPANFYRTRMDKDGTLYLSPLEVRTLYSLDKMYQINKN